MRILGPLFLLLLVSPSGRAAGAPGDVSGRVVMDALHLLPLRQVTVELFDPADPDLVVTRAVTDADGAYVFASAPAGKFGLRAWLSYVEPVTGDVLTIVNYPDWDAGFRIELTSSGEGQEPPDIVFPEPTILQSGLISDQTTWRAAVPFLTGDPLGAGGPGPASRPAHVPRKAVRDLPGLLCFLIPSVIDDPVDGYRHLAVDVSEHDRNAVTLVDWTENRIRPVLRRWLSDADLAQLRFTALSHSMGPLILKALLSDPDLNQLVTIDRAVSMDGTVGGVLASSVIFPLFFRGLAEGPLNGWSLFPGEPPFLPGWNDTRIDSTGTEWLHYSCQEPFIDFVLPDATAFGEGRSMWLLWPLVPSGFTHDTVTGHDVFVCDTHSGVHDNPDRLAETIAFLVRGRVPPGEVCPRVAPDRPLDAALFACPARILGRLQASAGETTRRRLILDGNDGARLWLLSTSGSQVVLRDSSRRVLEPRDQHQPSLGAGANLQSRDYRRLAPGPYSLELHAGARPAEMAFVLAHGGAPRLTAEAYPPVVRPGDFVTLRAVLESDAGLPEELPITLSEEFAGLSLFDDGAHHDGAPGDGVYGASVRTSRPGRHHALIQAVTDTYERGVAVEYVTLPEGARFPGSPGARPVVRVTASSRTITVEVPVEVQQVGDYEVVADLVDASGQRLHQVRARLRERRPGRRSLTLELPRPASVQAPLTLDPIYLMDRVTGLPLDRTAIRLPHRRATAR